VDVVRRTDEDTTLTGRLLAGLGIVAFQLWLSPRPSAQQPPKAATFINGQEEIQAGGRLLRVDRRVQQRRYVLKETGESLPYALFVSSKVTKAERSPLIVALHGFGANQNGLMLEHYRVVEFAEQGGYILAAPMGYSPDGNYGVPIAPGSGGRGNGPARDTIFTDTGGKAVTDRARKRELSEQDVLNVLALVKAEFNVDEHRTYLLGHSMGGQGALYLGVKHAPEWAAIAAIAPAVVRSPSPEILASVKTMPIILVHGDADPTVPVASTRLWVDTLKELGMTYEYHEIPGGDHGSAVTEGMPAIFAFFGKQSK
jgi:predicted esterase